MRNCVVIVALALPVMAGAGSAAGHTPGNARPGSAGSFPERDRDLIVAAYRGDLGAAEAALNAGADPNHRLDGMIHEWPFDSDGWTALHAAAYAGHPDVAALLIGDGADMRLTEGYGRTPLLMAVEACAYEGRGPETALMLIRLGSDVNVRARPMLDTRGGDTPLHLAVRASDLTLVKALIEAGARLNVRNDSGLTPLDVANQFGADYNVVELLKKSGAQASHFEPHPLKQWQRDNAVGVEGTIRK
jgi:ankyrin repeat protein